MPSALVLLPAAVLAGGSLAALAARLAAPVAVWAAAAATFVLWAESHGSLELAVGTLGAGIPATFRLDSVALVCSLAILVPGGAILTWRPGHEPARLAALAAGLLAVTSGDLVLTAAAAGAALAFGSSDARPRHTWPLWAGVLAAAWAGVGLQWVGGTATYGAAPPNALNVGIAGLMLVAAILLTGATPFASWTGGAWRLGSPLLLAVAAPIGLCLLFRLYLIGDGRLPTPALAAGLAAWAVLVLLGAAWRAQAAGEADAVRDEAVPEMAAFGLLAAAAGGVLGGAALALVALALGVLVALLAVLEPRRRGDALIALAVLPALPATLGFGARLLVLQALVEGDPAMAFWMVPAALAWLLWLAACVRLPGLPARAAAGVGRPVLALAAASFAAAAALGPLLSGVALPAARDASLGAIGPRPEVGVLSLNPVSGGWMAIGAAVVALVLVAATVSLRQGLRMPRVESPLPAPPRWTPPALRLGAPMSAGAVERALSGTRPVLWGVLIAALALIVTRIAT